MMNQDGLRNGYDLAQLKLVRGYVGSTSNCIWRVAGKNGYIFVMLLLKQKVDGALAASVFHKQIIEIGELKSYLVHSAIEIRSE